MLIQEGHAEGQVINKCSGSKLRRSARALFACPNPRSYAAVVPGGSKYYLPHLWRRSGPETVVALVGHQAICCHVTASAGSFHSKR